MHTTRSRSNSTVATEYSSVCIIEYVRSMHTVDLSYFYESRVCIPAEATS